jgi:hypothetical protein
MCAVAEMDYIMSAGADDFESVAESFGFVCVPSEEYGEAVSLLRARGLDCGRLLVPFGAQCGEAYPSIALASVSDGIVLSDSENVRRLCLERGVACMGAGGWRSARGR